MFVNNFELTGCDGSIMAARSAMLSAMEYRTLGPTDLRISAVCLGTMTFGRQTPEAGAHAQMDLALERGVNFFDTAEIYAVPPSAETYGVTETIIGNWFTARGNRDQAILATKMAGEGPQWIRSGNNSIDRRNIVAAVEGSLRRLRTDYIDVYQLHWPNRGSYHFGQVWDYRGGRGETAGVVEELRETLQTLDELIAAGKIRHIGLSNETAWGVMRYLELSRAEGLPRMVSIQNEYNLLNRMAEPDMAEIVQRENVAFLAWSPLATGLLTGKYHAGARPAGSRWQFSGSGVQRDTPQAHRATAEYLDLARRYNLDPARLALAFVHSRPFVGATIIGATTVEQLEHDLPAFDLELEESVLNDIARIRRDFPLAY